jgi:hypothetical protein
VALLDQLAGACDAVDRILSAAPSPAPPEPPPWARDTELVELFQDLLSAASQRDGRFALLQIERLRGVLALRHGIATVEFSEDHQDLFALAPPPDPSTGHGPDPPGSSASPAYSTVRPALVAKAGSEGTPARVLLRGEARGPAPTPPGGSARNRPPARRDEPHD